MLESEIESYLVKCVTHVGGGGVSALTAERTKLIGISADEVANTFDAFAEVARKVDMPPLEEIAQVRMDLMRNEYGIARFLEPVWWRWLWMSMVHNA